MIELRLKLLTMRGWLLERLNPMYQVNLNKPEGKIKNRWWVETREWGKPTTRELISLHFRKTAKGYKNHK